MSDTKPNNRWIHGVITRAPEAKVANTKDGEQNVASFSIAVKGANGEYYLTCTAWNEASDVMLLVKRNGTPVSVYGEPKSEQYNGKTYWKVNTRHVEIPSNILFAALGKSESSQPSQHQQQKQNGYMPEPDFAPMEQDDIPF